MKAHTLYDIAYIHGMDRVGCEYGSLGAFIVSDGFMSFSRLLGRERRICL